MPSSSTNSNTTNEGSSLRAQLRKRLREARRSLTSEQQLHASQQLLKNLLEHPAYAESQHIALYLAQDGEIDPCLVIEDAWSKNKNIYLPVVDSQGSHTMTFYIHRKDTVMVNNQYGIPEPDSSRYPDYPAWSLDMVLLPLTGFDASGNRMGMGGGYYDRTFSFLQSKTTTSDKAKDEQCNPLLIGLAHECQRVSQIPVECWDIPLAGIITDKTFYPC